jgi:hypothetical protein
MQMLLVNHYVFFCSVVMYCFYCFFLQLFLKVNCVGIKLLPRSWIYLSKFVPGLPVRKYATPAKRKWTKNDIQMLKDWKEITDEVFGPVVKDVKEKTKKGKQTVKRSSPVSNKELGAQQFTDVNAMTVENDCRHSLKLTGTNENCYNGDGFEDGDLLNSSNFSETKLLSAKHEGTKQDTYQRTAGKPADNSNSMDINHNLYSFDVGSDTQHVSFLVDSDDTTDYQWVDQPLEVAANATASLTSESVMEVAKVVPNSCKGVGETTVEMNQSKIRGSKNASAQPSDAIQSDSVQCEDAEKSSVMKSSRDTVMPAPFEGNQSQLFSESFILSFPLFIPDSKNRVAASNSKNAAGRLPSVTKILQATQSLESRMALERWEKQMIAELGEQGFAKYKAGGDGIFSFFLKILA